MRETPLMIYQGDIADELEEHAEPLSGRSRHRNERQDQQYGQLRAGQPQPQLSQYHLYAQTATSTPAIHHKQVNTVSCIRVLGHICCFASRKRRITLGSWKFIVGFWFSFISAACQDLV